MNEAKQTSRQVDTDILLSYLRLTLSQFSHSHDSWLSKQDFEKKIDEISDWVQKQKKSPDDKSVHEGVENVCKIANAIVSAAKKFQTGKASDVVSGTMEIISSFVTFAGAVGGPAVVAILGTICNVIGAILTAENHSNKPSVVEQLANVVHEEVVAFNRKLQQQKYNGLKDRVLEQKTQLRAMMSGEEELVDRNLWTDYVQFMGEVSNRVESWLPFKYEDDLTRDPDMADFVAAVVTYCEAYCCFLALLISAKGKFADLEATKGHFPGQKDKAREYLKVIDLKISCQIEDAKRKLSFLSEGKYLTFVGSLPSAGGKLTKIVALSRTSPARSLVEMVTSSVGLPPLPDLTTVESKAEIVSRQSVKLKLEGVPELPVDGPERKFCTVQFINKTKFPIKVISGAVGDRVRNMKFTEAVEPGSYIEKIPCLCFSLGGYIIIYLDGKVREDDTPHAADVTRVIEFALSDDGLDHVRNDQLVPIKVNIQDKTCSEFTKGQNTYSKMKNGERTTRTYWVTNEVHHMASGDGDYIFVPLGATPFLWRFVVQDFDPVLDVVTRAKQDKKEEESTCLIL